MAEVPWEPPASWRSETLDAASPVRPAGSFPGLSPSVPAEPSPSVLGAAQAASLPPALGASQPSRPQTQESGDRDVRARLSTVPRRPWLHPRTVASIREVRGEAEEAGDHARGGTRDGARDEPRDDARDEVRSAIREAAADGTDATRQPAPNEGIRHDTERVTEARQRGISADAWVTVAITWEGYVRLRPRLVASGGRWNPDEQVCEIQYRHAYALGIADRVRALLPSSRSTSAGAADELDRGMDPGTGPARHIRRPGSGSVAEQCIAYA